MYFQQTQVMHIRHQTEISYPSAENKDREMLAPVQAYT